MTHPTLHLRCWPVHANGPDPTPTVLAALRQHGAACQAEASGGGTVRGISVHSARAVLEQALPYRNGVLLTDDVYQAQRLVLLDVDATLVQGESLDLLASTHGVGKEVAQLTAQGMHGTLNFTSSLEARLNLLAGCPTATVHAVAQHLRFTPGGRELVSTLIQLGHVVVAVSGGFHDLLDPLLGQISGLQVHANVLSHRHGALTGHHQGDIWDAPGKASLLHRLSAEHGIPVEHSIAVGDGANDALMLGTAGCSVAFNGKEAARTAAHAWLDHPSLIPLLGLVPSAP